MSNDPPPGLWQRRSVDETMQLYADWADTYDADVRAWGYATPGRIATALAGILPDMDAPILDFGCGTGLSGLALRAQGFTCVDGTDASLGMIEHAQTRAIYRKTWHTSPGQITFPPGTYRAITAIGVISSGAAPAQTLDLVLDGLNAGGILALSFNDATLADPAYTSKLQHVLDSCRTRLLFSEHGPHLPEKNMNSTIYILEKT